MGDELTERLKSHARAFDSLLSLIPAKLYYGEDVSDQWKRKKQTPEQKRAAKMAKLDPDNWKSAKDVMDERAAAAALKRKRDDDDAPIEDPANANPNPTDDDETEQPKPKKRKADGNSKKTVDQTPEEKQRQEAEERAAKRERKREKKVKAKEKAERQKNKKKEAKLHRDVNKSKPEGDEAVELQLQLPVHLESVQNADGPSQPEPTSPSTASSEEEPEDVFSPHHESATSSTSSILPASLDETMKTDTVKPTLSLAAEIDTTKTPQERLHEALTQFRASRKADTAEPKSRQELLDQRRQKEAQRKAAKKEQKRREKEEEARLQDEEIARRFSPGGSGSLLASPRSPIIGDNNESSNNFTFGRIAFADGTNLDPANTDDVEAHHKKGPRDAASQLQLAQSKKSRLASLDEEKRTRIEEKDMWLNAKKRAHGEHVRDDTSLLKKALKRQQTQKKKSENEWGERIDGVRKAQETKQKKREQNLSKRKEEKRVGGGGGGGKGKKVKRPGFEGSFKGRTGGKKKS